jgi:RNA polymerase sigma-70 factor (ECF subfamily)
LSQEAEASLIDRIKAGETHLFPQLIRPYLGTLGAICRSLLDNRADAEEALQETMLKALAHFQQLQRGECVRGWLMQIAINEARMMQRKYRTHPQESIEQKDQQHEGEEFSPLMIVDPREIPFELVERKELRAAIARALRSLNVKYREVFVLRDLQNLTVRQTAHILGISEAAVNLRLHRARVQLRKQLSPFSPEAGGPRNPESSV